MKNIYFLILKKRWFLFTILFLLVFLTNSVLWNESTQLIRRYPAIERLKIEADKGSYESLYIPEADETGALISISMEERNELYHTLLTALRDGRAIYRNKIAYIEKGEKLQLLTAIKLKDIFSKEELSEHFLNDILFKKSRDNKELFKKIIAINQAFSIKTMKASYQVEKDYYMNNFYFAVAFSCLLLTFAFFILYWLLSASIKICQGELRLLRVIGAGEKWLRGRFLILFSIPIVMGFIGMVLFIFAIGLNFIWADWIYLLVFNLFFIISAHVNISRHTKGVFNA